MSLEKEGLSVRLLYELDGASQLDNAWSDSKTFVFLSNHSGVTKDWLLEQIQLLPPLYHQGRFILLTSGSTGHPKLIVANKERSENLVRILHKIQQSEAVQQTIVLLPLTYTFAFVNQWLWSRSYKRELKQTPGLRDPQGLAEILLKSKESMLCMVGAQLPFLRTYFSNMTFPGIIRLHFAGGPFPQSELDFTRQLFPNASIFNNYGCSEAMPRLTIRPAEQSLLAHNVGAPIPGVQLRIREGRVEFQSQYQAEGQISNGHFEPFDNEAWLPSGDKGEIDEKGHLILLGRSDEVFKRYGEKISLPQLTQSIKELWKGQSIFYNEEDSKGENGHVLLLSPEPEKSMINSILRLFRKRYSRTHWPLRIESTAKIPLLNNGKKDQQAVKKITNKTIHWTQRI